MEFWEWMIQGGRDFSSIRQDQKFGGYGPWHARNEFKASSSREDGPVWTFNRFGASRTHLNDGRVICVGGEHEDYYDADFCIYNDVVVITPSNQVEIYGYPAEVFPPTDFHTATLFDDRLFIVGSLGYQNARRPGETPVYVFNLPGYEVSVVQTFGEAPGWIHNHAAESNADRSITIRGGELVYESNGVQVLRRNFDDYVLNVASGSWRRATHRNWLQFKVRQEDKKLFVLERDPGIEAVLPEGARRLPKSSLYPRFTRIEVGGIPIALHLGVYAIEIVVEDDLPDIAREIAEQVRTKAEAAIHKPCILISINP